MVGADNRPGSHGYARVNIKKLKRNINKVTKKQMTKAEKKGEWQQHQHQLLLRHHC